MAQKNHFLKPRKLWNAQCKASGLRHNNKKTEAFWIGSFVGKLGSLSIQRKLSKIWKQRQMVQKFPGKVSRNSRNCWISEMRAIQPKILEIRGAKLNKKESSGKKISKIWVYPPRLSSLFEILENAVPFATIYTGRETWSPYSGCKKNHLYSSPEAEYS